MSGFKNFALCTILAALTVCTPVVAGAQQAERVPYDRALMAKLPSTNDEIGIAFLKMAGNFPEFTKVVAESATFKNMNTLAQQDYQAKMAGKLQSSYVAFSPTKSDIIIRLKVNALFKKFANGEGQLKIRTFKTDPVYFPFYFANYPIALIIKDMENFRDIRLSKEDTAIVYSRMALSGDVTMLLQLYAVAANDTKPMVLDNIPQYPLLTEIGYIGLLNSQAEQVWAWRNEKLGGKRITGGDSRNLVDLIPDKSGAR